jgi:hypothetical protein
MENVSIPAHLIQSVIKILSNFDYEADEDSARGMSFFQGRINEDHFFAVKSELEKFLQ